MNIKLFDFRSALSHPSIYEFFKIIIKGRDVRYLYVKKYIKPKEGDRVLDIGCGPANILEHFPNVEYVGFDIEKKYIDSAIKYFGSRGQFFCKKLSRDVLGEKTEFDIVIAIGVLHHLNDDEAMELFELANSVMKSSSRLITVDGCYTDGQSGLARFILSRDRGRYVRTKEAYINLASKVFSDIKVNIHDDLLRIPYTHIVMECSKN